MATYPSIGVRARITPTSPMRSDVSEAGGVRTVDLGETIAYRIEVTHPLINTTDRDTLLTFYDTNRGTVNEITLGGITYDAQYITPYTETSDNSTLWTLTAVLAGNKQ